MQLYSEKPTSEDELSGLEGIVIDGRYRVDEYIDCGGMGDVYAATQLSLGRTVAIKLLRTERIHAKRDEVRKRFELEARTAARIDHPNATPIFDYGVYQQRPYLVMKFLSGETLKDVLARNKTISCKRTSEICRDVCAALEAAHAERVVHRDLKPGNIMLVPRSGGGEDAMVLDFGIAKILERPGEHVTTLTSDGVLLGTPLYMSPEQIRGAEIDQRSDIYSLGIILYQLLTGHLPFPIESAADVIVGHLNVAPTPLRTHRGSIPAPVEAVILRALEKTPEKRYQRASELADSLQSALSADMRCRSAATAGPRSGRKRIGDLTTRFRQIALAPVPFPPLRVPFAIGLPAFDLTRMRRQMRVAQRRSCKELRDALAGSPWAVLASAGFICVLVGVCLLLKPLFELAARDTIAKSRTHQSVVVERVRSQAAPAGLKESENRRWERF